VIDPAAPIPWTIRPASRIWIEGAKPPIKAPRRKTVRERRRMGFRPKETESVWKGGWKMVEHRRKLVARRKVGVVVAWREVAIACALLGWMGEK
jgi:hypothetical protein